MDPATNAQQDSQTDSPAQPQTKDLHRVPAAKDSPRHSFLASPYPAMATTLPATRQQTYEEQYGPPENILEIEVSPRKDRDPL